ncbi:conserved exported hypothetical protein [Paraburkholderia tropica]|uniref:hypothetical protein n=1 Tax=Paraburkholderia TaxID=1822464 RepID=UPI001CB2ABB7|nr:MULTISPECIES: hypothetical protein [Paraburkholderia]CAG9223530.1 conserved exported hypothetical protein [Paraburkholderia tropica]
MKRTLIAAAVLAAVSGSALASPKDPYIFNATIVGERVGIEGWITLFGCVSVSSTAGAVVNNNQMVTSNNISMKPNPANYTSGSITTHVNNSYTSAKGGGSAFVDVSTWSSSKQTSAQGSQASAGYVYGQQSKQVQGGGYEYSQQSAGIGGYFYNTQQSQGAHISASGKASGSLSYVAYNGRHSGYDAFQAKGSLSAGYNESSYAKGSGVGGYFEATEGSGQGKSWSYQAKEGSGYVAYGEQSSSYKDTSSKTNKGGSIKWGIDSSLATTDVTVTGSVTQHFNNQPANTLTATTGDGAAKGASGNIGVNIAEGVNNAQSNDASLAAVDAGNVFGNAQIFNTQSSGGNVKVNNYVLNAGVGNNALAGATGNIGVNVASGVGNAQNNSLAASTTTSGANASYAMVATDQTSQTANTSFQGSFAGTAMLGSGALANATGNIGVNIAGGVGNVQHNGLAIAAMSVPVVGK